MHTRAQMSAHISPADFCVFVCAHFMVRFCRISAGPPPMCAQIIDHGPALDMLLLVNPPTLSTLSKDNYRFFLR